MTGGDELIGHWSVEHGYHTSMEDEWLMFRADGSGWYAYLRPWFSHIIEFRWTRLDPRVVRVEAYQDIELDEQDGQDQLTRRSLARVEDVACELARAQRPLLDNPVDELASGCRSASVHRSPWWTAKSRNAVSFARSASRPDPVRTYTRFGSGRSAASLLAGHLMT